MRLSNLTIKEKEKIKRDYSFLLKALEEEFSLLKEDIIDFPLEKIDNLRGQAIILRKLIKLLR